MGLRDAKNISENLKINFLSCGRQPNFQSRKKIWNFMKIFLQCMIVNFSVSVVETMVETNNPSQHNFNENYCNENIKAKQLDYSFSLQRNSSQIYLLSDL